MHAKIKVEAVFSKKATNATKLLGMCLQEDCTNLNCLLKIVIFLLGLVLLSNLHSFIHRPLELM